MEKEGRLRMRDPCQCSPQRRTSTPADRTCFLFWVRMQRRQPFPTQHQHIIRGSTIRDLRLQPCTLLLLHPRRQWQEYREEQQQRE